MYDLVRELLRLDLVLLGLLLSSFGVCFFMVLLYFALGFTTDDLVLLLKLFYGLICCGVSCYTYVIET